MTTISEARKNPYYNKYSDEKLADLLHQKFYSDLPKEKAYEKIGYVPKSEEDIHELLKKKAIEDVTTSSNYTDPLELIKAALMGLGEGGQNIATTLTGGYSPTVDMGELFGVKNPTVLQKLISGGIQFLPVTRAAGLLPKAVKGLKYGMGLIPEALISSGYGALQSPENKKVGAFVGGGSNLGFGALEQLLQKNNPVIKTLAKALFGGGVGYGLNGPEGAIEGGAGATILPKVAKKMGMSINPAKDITSQINPEEVKVRAQAGNRLGTFLTPGEASGRPDITAMEARIGKEGVAAPERIRIGQERIANQKKAIEDLYKKISPSDSIASFDVRKSAQDAIEEMKKAREEAVEPYYKIAHEKKVAPNLIKSLKKSDKNIDIAIDEAMNDPKYQVEGELLNVPENSIKMLDYAKRKIDSKIEQAKNFGDNDAVRVLTASKNKLLDSIENFSPDFKAARSEYSRLSKPIEEIENSQVGQIARLKDTQLKNVSKNIFDPSQTDINVLRKIKDHVQSQNPEAWDNIVKNEMNRLMTQGRKTGVTGRSFFDNVLSNDNRFKQFQIALEHNPKALQSLNDMKTAWEHLINIETPRTAAGQSASKVNMWRNSVDAIVGAYNNLFGGEKQISALKYLYSDKWQKDIQKVKRMAPKEQKKMMSILIGKTIVPSYLLNDKENKK